MEKTFRAALKVPGGMKLEKNKTILFSNDAYVIFVDVPDTDKFSRSWQGFGGITKLAYILNHQQEIDDCVESRESIENLSRKDMQEVIHKLKNKLSILLDDAGPGTRYRPSIKMVDKDGKL